MGRAAFYLEDRRQGDADSAANRVDGRAGGGAQPRPAAVLFDLDLAEIGEIVDDALPFEPAAASCETVEELLAQDEREKGAEDVAANAGVGLVKDGAGGE